MIDRIAEDLGINHFSGESNEKYECRVIYSAMACWIKTIALDNPIGIQREDSSGVSRRRIHEKGHSILKTMIKMIPEVGVWFESAEEEDPINLIRNRLINHHDLLNAGFGTNLALSAIYSNQISIALEAVYGKLIEKGIFYSGVSSIREKRDDSFTLQLEDNDNMFIQLLKNAWWSHDLPDLNMFQFFNPRTNSKNNDSAWQNSLFDTTDNIILVRNTLNDSNHSFYLLKRKERLLHKIDPFLKEQGYHIRVMYALRSRANNKVEARVKRFNDHIILKLNAWLPTREKLLLESYSWPVRKINDNLEWIMDYQVWDYLKPFFDALEIKLTEENHG